MRRLAPLLLAALGWIVVSGAARADVPRSCVHPRFDPIACKRDFQRGYEKVLPSARLRVRAAQRREFERVAPTQDVERNVLLEEIRDALPASSGSRR